MKSKSEEFNTTTLSTQQRMGDDYAVRSLRRRMWKAFQKDDAETALRAYQASYEDFQRWIEEDQREKEAAAEKAAAAASLPGTPKGTPSRTKERKRNSTGRRNSGGSNTRRSSGFEDMADINKSMADIHRVSGISILQSSQFNPSEPFIADDFLSPDASYDEPAKKFLPDLISSSSEKKKIRRRKQARSAFNPFSFKKGNNNINGGEEIDNNNNNDLQQTDTEEDTIFQEDVNMTTPLHEAARLGDSNLVRILLKNGGDANIKNGRARTALHMCAGGLTKEEEAYIDALNEGLEGNNDDGTPGIRPPAIPKNLIDFMNEMNANTDDDKKRKAKKGVNKLKAVSRMLMRSSATSKNKAMEDAGVSKQLLPKPQLDLRRLEQIVEERSEATVTLLMWSDISSGAGVSLNAVDDVGRTALHYAAEMGRTEICTAIMSSFGTMLTIVDELGARTPCECASRQGHKDLAAMLEARTLLYVDPYGLDDELLGSLEPPDMGFDEFYENPELVPPFNWFETLMPRDVEEDRQENLTEGIQKMRKALQQSETARATRDKVAAADKKVAANDKKKSPNDGKQSKKSDVEILMETAAEIGLEAAMDAMDLENLGSADREEIESKIESTEMDFSNMQDAHIERFLAFHGWDTYDAVSIFRKNPTDAFRKAAIHLPTTARQKLEVDDMTCPICYDTVEKEQWMDLDGCGHGFCRDCLKGYLKDCAKSLTPVAMVSCPQHQCEASICQKDLDSLLHKLPKTKARFSEATMRHYVTSSSNLKFCTHPGCPGVVKRLTKNYFTKANLDPDLHDYFGAVCTGVRPKRPPTQSLITYTYDGVDDPEYTNCQSHSQPKKAHRFCFSCGESMHWPVPCERLKEWKQKMRDEIDVVEDEDADVDANELAQKMWIKANTRACPKCNVLIEKNEGCNHMTCVNPNCRYEFCWICRKDWKLHGTSTGGFFRCNIWQEEESPDGNSPSASSPQRNGEDAEDDQGFGTAIHSAREQYRQRQEMNRFLHHYTRYEAHGESANLEKKMAASASSRLAPVVYAAIDFDGSRNFNFGGKGLSFIHKAFTELLECRSTLKYSYAFSYFRYPTFFKFRQIEELNNIRKEKATFESYQSELEMITEQMSDVVARSHMRASQNQITYLCAGAAEKRVDFSNLMFQILNKELRKSKKGKLRRRKNRPRLNPFTGEAESSDEEGERRKQNSRVESVRNFLDSVAAVSSGTLDDGGMWACNLCTFMNHGGRACAMCETLRPST